MEAAVLVGYGVQKLNDLAEWQFYESALNDHENAFRNIMKTHETKCTKTHGKSLQKRMDKVYESASI